MDDGEAGGAGAEVAVAAKGKSVAHHGEVVGAGSSIEGRNKIGKIVA